MKSYEIQKDKVFRHHKVQTGGKTMKGYTTENGYMGFVNGEYVLFVSDNEYYEYLEA